MLTRCLETERQVNIASSVVQARGLQIHDVVLAPSRPPAPLHAVCTPTGSGSELSITRQRGSVRLSSAMCQPPPDNVVREMLGPHLSEDIAIEKVQLVPSDRPLRVHQVLLSDGRTLHLVLPPVSMWRPLRVEQDMLGSEATTVLWIRQALLGAEDSDAGEKISQSLSKPGPGATILPRVPNLLHRGRESHLSDASFAVYDPIRGTPLSRLPAPPTPASQREIDRQLGNLFRSLATLTAPTGRFGPLAAVIGADTPEPAHPLGERATRLLKGLIEGGLSVTRGAGTWSVAFHSMLESVLRDGEDMAVVMPYPTIRKYFRQLGYLLDEVTVPRLVVVEAGDTNVLVAEEGKRKGDGLDGEREEEGVEVSEHAMGDSSGEKPEHENGAGRRLDKGKGPSGPKQENKETDEEQRRIQQQGQQRYRYQHQQQQQQQQQQQHQRGILKLSGLRDWSSAVFGDPLLATVFSDPVGYKQPPSSAFLEGFNAQDLNHDGDTGHEPTAHNLPYPIDSTIIQGVDTAWIRILFYQVYHAVRRIVGEFYRPRPDSSARELEARRQLSAVLTKLAWVSEEAKKRRPRPTGEMSPAKRLKSASDGG